MKKIISLTLIIALFSTFSACSGSERLKNMTVVQGVGIDVCSEGCEVTLQYLDINKGNGKNDSVSSNITATVSGRGASLENAVKNAENKLPDSLFFGQNKIIVVSAEYEKLYSTELKKRLASDRRSRPDVLIMKSRGKASAVIKNAQCKTRVPADSIFKQVKKNKKAVTVSQYLAGKALHYYR